MSICKTQDPYESLTEQLMHRNWVKKNRYLHFRDPKVQEKNVSHFLVISSSNFTATAGCAIATLLSEN